jgi:HK97 family phage portal protein
MRWWPFQRKGNPTAGTMFAGLGLTIAAFPKLESRMVVREGFNGNVTAYSAIMQKGNAGAGIPWCLYRRPLGRGSRPKKIMSRGLAMKAWQSGHPHARKAAEVAEIEDHPLLRLLENPNPLQGGASFHQARICHLNIHGNAYVVGAGAGVDAGRPPFELWLMRPDRVTIVPHAVNTVGGYVYEVAGAKQSFGPLAVMHQLIFNAEGEGPEELYGMSPLRAAMRNILTVNEATRWNYSLLRNSARPPVAIVMKGTASETTWQEMREQVDDIYAGADNAGRPILLEGTMDVKDLGFGPAEMEWLAGLKHGDRKVAQALNVPPILVGDGDGATYANVKEARKQWYHDDVLPQADRDRDDFNRWLTPRYGDGLYLDYDRDQIEALNEEQALLWSRIERSTSLTVNEKRAALGYDTLPDGDRLLVPAALVPLGDVVR